MSELLTLRTDDVPIAMLGDLHRLCDAVFDHFGDEDWEHALGGWHILVVDGPTPISHAAVVPRTLWVADQSFDAGYVEAVATAADRHGEGLGSRVMTEINRLIEEHFELGGLSTGRHSFYERLGWERWQGPTYVRRDGEVVRTEDEDDGVMVLRVEESASVDLGAPIECEARPGDDW